MKNSLIFAFTVIGTIIGAGYATGQELFSFFIIKSNNGLWYFLFSSFLLITMSITIFLYSKNRKIYSTENLFSNLFNKTLSKISIIISTLFLFACFCVTSAGTGSLFKESLNFPYFFGVITIILITYAAMQFDINGVFFINAMLTPVIIVSILLLGTLSLNQTHDVSSIFSNFNHTSGAFLNSLMYFGYNFLSLIPIILTSAKKVNKSTVIKGLLFSFFIILITGAVMIISMYNTSDILETYSLPFLKIVSDISLVSKNLYTLIMYFAMITTAVSCFFGLYQNISNVIIGRKNFIIIVCLLISLIATLFGFSNLVRNVYSIFGIFGVFISIFMLYRIIIKNI